MNLRKMAIQGVLEINTTAYEDERGKFLNAFRIQEEGYKKVWKDRTIKQVNLSVTNKIGTIRGIHCQKDPHQEAKLVRCLKGGVLDIIVDLRKKSPTFGNWEGVLLSPNKLNAVFIPEGCGHGFQVIEEGSELLYLHSGEWRPEYDSGVVF